MARRHQNTESAIPRWRAAWDRIPWAPIGQVGSVLTAMVAIVALVQVFTKEAPDLVAQCYAVANRASLEPLVKRDVDARTETAKLALKEALAVETWPQAQKDSFVARVE